MTALQRIDQAISAMGDGLDWALDVLRPVLPAGLSGAGLRSVRRIVDVNPDQSLSERGALATSLLGATQPRPAQAASGQAPVIGVLPEAAQFRITTTLSEAAARAGRSAIALRLERLSPIPVEEAVFAYRRIAPPGVMPVEVEVSIARRSAIEAAARTLTQQCEDWRLVGDLARDGRPALEFQRSGRQSMGLGLKALIVSAAIAVALFAWSGRLEQAAAALQTDQARLALDARATATADRRLEMIAAAQRQSLDAPRVGDWMTALSGLASEETAFSTLGVADGAVFLEADGERVATASIGRPSPADAPSRMSEAAP